jgi:hypothetical protein
VETTEGEAGKDGDRIGIDCDEAAQGNGEAAQGKCETFISASSASSIFDVASSSSKSALK